MSCSALTTAFGDRPSPIQVNGVAIPRAAIAREAQNHPAGKPIAAWQEAARALVVRELLLQEARRLGIVAEPLTDADGRRETEEEAVMRALLDQEVVTPEPDEESCHRYYLNNRRRFRSPDIFEASHILFSASRADDEKFDLARRNAEGALAILRQNPRLFADFAATYSACPSAGQGGNLGQITTGQTTPEFERALAGMQAGQLCNAPVETRYGLHIIRLDRKIEAQILPFAAVAGRIAGYLREATRRHACVQYVARLASRATIEGVTLPTAAELRVH